MRLMCDRKRLFCICNLYQYRINDSSGRLGATLTDAEQPVSIVKNFYRVQPTSTISPSLLADFLRGTTDHQDFCTSLQGSPTWDLGALRKGRDDQRCRERRGATESRLYYRRQGGRPGGSRGPGVPPTSVPMAWSVGEHDSRKRRCCQWPLSGRWVRVKKGLSKRTQRKYHHGRYGDRSMIAGLTDAEKVSGTRTRVGH